MRRSNIPISSAPQLGRGTASKVCLRIVLPKSCAATKAFAKGLLRIPAKLRAVHGDCGQMAWNCLLLTRPEESLKAAIFHTPRDIRTAFTKTFGLSQGREIPPGARRRRYSG